MDSTLFSLPALATALLLLATSRSWHARRAWAESVSLCALVLLAALGLARTTTVAFNALLPLVAVGAAWLAFSHGEWRFAPDRGQRGYAWAFYSAATPTLPAALGSTLALPLCAYLNRTAPEPVVSATIVASAMLLAHAFHRALAPRRTPHLGPDFPDDDGGNIPRAPVLAPLA